MARNVSPNFQKVQNDPYHDQNYQSPSLKTLNSYIETLNPNEISHFLSHLSNPKNPENFSENEKLSSLAQLIKTQGLKITPYINSIITILIQTISSNNHTNYPLNLHNSCSNLISNISQYAIDPLASEKDKIGVLASLIIPLSDQLMNSNESTTSICAFCIKALVETDNWKYAPDELVDQICSKLAGSLEEGFCKTLNSHLELVISLSTLNPLTIEPYSRSIIRSGLNIFSNNSGPHMKLVAIEMIISLMKYIDPRAISCEINSIINALQSFEMDRVPVGIHSTVFEAIEMARSIGAKSEFEFDKIPSPIEGLIMKSSHKPFMQEFDNISESPLNGSGFKRVNGFGSKEDNSRCDIHERCNRCTATNSPVWDPQRLGRTNSMDNLRTFSSPKKDSPNVGLLQDQVNSKTLQYNGSPNHEFSPINGSHNRDCLTCEVCHKENKREIRSKKNRRCSRFALSMVLGFFVVIFAVIFRVWLVNIDEEVYFVPT